MDNLASLCAFVKVVELDSFSETRRLLLSRSAISKCFSDLEHSLASMLNCGSFSDRRFQIQPTGPPRQRPAG
jgi:hypothetical protein